MPGAPGWLDKLNFITKYIFNSCDTPLIVYAETAREPAGRLALAFLTFGMDDLIRSYFRPKGLRTKRHGRKGRKGKKRGGIPETSDMIAEKLPGYEKTRGRHVSDGVKNLWKIDGIGQRLLWYWMLADELTDFFYDWTSAIVKSDQSTCPNTYRRLQETKNHTFRSTGVTYGPLLLGTTVYVHGPIGRAGHIYNLGPGTYQVVVSVTARNSGPFNRTSEMQVRIRDRRNDAKEYSSLTGVPNGQKANFVAAMQTKGPGAIEIAFRNSRQFAVIEEAECFIYGYAE